MRITGNPPKKNLDGELLISWRVPSRYKGVLGLRFVLRGVGRNFSQPAARNSQPLNINRYVACSLLARFCSHDHTEKVAMIKFDVMHLLGVIKERISPDRLPAVIDIGDCTSCRRCCVQRSWYLLLSHRERFRIQRAIVFQELSSLLFLSVKESSCYCPCRIHKTSTRGCSTFSLSCEKRAFAGRRHPVDDWPFFTVRRQTLVCDGLVGKARASRMLVRWIAELRWSLCRT